MPNEAYIEALRQAGNLNKKILDVPPYDVIKHLRDNPIMGPNGMVNTSAIKDAANVSLGLLGIGASMPAMSNAAGAFRASLRGSKPTYWSDSKLDRLRALDQRLEGRPVKEKLTEFRAQNPDYQGSDSHLRTMLFRIKDKEGGSTLGSNFGNFGERPPGGPLKPRLNTDAPGMAIAELQSRIPPQGHEAWVKQWAESAGVPIKDITGKDTKYIRLQPENPPIGDKYLTVRVPQDPERHIASNASGRNANTIDTGIGLVVPKTGERISNNKLTRLEPGLLNESGMPYFDIRALDARLKYETNKAPGGGNWLIPEEMKPRQPFKPVQETQGPQLPEGWVDPSKQLKLLSSGGGYSTQDIINLLKQKNQDGPLSPFET